LIVLGPEKLTNTLQELTEINLNDLVSSFGWEDRRILKRLLVSTFGGAARKFARQMLDFDRDVSNLGLNAASKILLMKYARSLTVFGIERIPEGPVLALSNHPGMVDTISLFTTLNRDDLRIIAVHRPFLRSLEHTSKRLDYLDDDPRRRIPLVRKVSKHLRSGGAVLTFPSGKIDPDPSVYPGAEDALVDWMDSVGVFVRLAPETVVLPILVHGVIWKSTAIHPLVKLKRAQEDSERLAAALQLLAHISLGIRPLDVVVHIGEPVKGAELPTDDKTSVHHAVLAEMRKLIWSRPGTGGTKLV
jgi:hypothetical protein